MTDFTTQFVDATKWSEMDVSELTEQRNRMYDRYDFLISKKQNVSVLLHGIIKLENLIQQKNII